MDIIKGQCWVFGRDVDTDQILPGYAMAEAAGDLGKFAMAGSEIQDFAARVNKGDIIVAGPNFGSGSSREQAPQALKLAGVSLIIAPSFARIFRRNAINIGLPVLMADLTGLVKTGEVISVDLGRAKIEAAGKSLEAQPLSASVLETLEAGGLIPRVRKELGVES